MYFYFRERKTIFGSLFYIVALYIVAVTPLALYSSRVWTRTGNSLTVLIVTMVTITLFVAPPTYIGVISNSVFFGSLMLGVSEELARLGLFLRLKFLGGDKYKAIAIALPFSLIETTNWLFSEKASSRFRDEDFQDWFYVALDVIRILSEFLGGVILHGLMALILIKICKKAPSSARIFLSLLITIFLHSLFNFFILSGNG